MELSEQELHLIQQWFDIAQDFTSPSLDRQDYLLARRIYEALAMRVPHSISDHC